MTVPLEFIVKFDKVLDKYMLGFAGENWRTMCHQSAKIAAKSLLLLLPNLKIEMRRVELIAKMDGGNSFVHIGWLEDSNKIQGKFPAHFAVAIGSGLYDPTFYQLRFAKTPLDLPDEPFFYFSEFFKTPKDREGFRWLSERRPTGRLHIAYMMQSTPIPEEEKRKLMSDGIAKKHAKKVSDLFRKYVK